MTTTHDVDPRLAEAHALVRDGKHREAAQIYSALLEHHPDDDVARSHLGVALHRMKRYREAEHHFRRLALQRTRSPEDYYNLALSLEAQRRLDEAVAALDEALQRRPSFERARRRRDKIIQTRTPRADGHAPAAPSEPSPVTSGSTATPPPSAPVIDAPVARLLDEAAARPPEETLGGPVVSRGRGLPVNLLPAALLALLVLIVPDQVKELVTALPGGALRTAGTGLWRFLEALSYPVALLLIGGALLSWYSSTFVVRSHRLEVAAGLLSRRQIVLWYYDIERQPVLRQRLWEAMFGLASIEVTSTAIPPTASRRSWMSRGSLPVGTATIAYLPADRAAALISGLRASILWERRPMTKNFISSR